MVLLQRRKIILFLIFPIVGVYSFLIEPNWLEVSFHTIEINEKKSKLRIAHLTDLHSSEVGLLERAVLSSIAEYKPDVIFITGDISTPYSSKGYLNFLRLLKAPKGVYFVNGNWEYWAPIPSLKETLNDAQIQDLTNKTIKIEKRVRIIGFDDMLTGKPDLNSMEQLSPDPGEIKIALFHSPVFYEVISHKINLAFSGHSHGGQIRMPFFGAFWTPDGTAGYESGWFEKNGSKMFVSRGIGTSILPIRFNCRPELAIIDLHY